MKKVRPDSYSFNPENFLLHEKKKATAGHRPSSVEFSPIVFSKGQAKRFIDRVAVEFPDAFCIGLDWEKMVAPGSVWQHLMATELASIGVFADPELIRLLLLDMACRPYWRRVVRRIKTA